MAKKIKPRADGLAWSTDSNFFNNYNAAPALDSLPNDKQQLYVSLDSRQRAGRTVTIIQGFYGKEEDMVELSKKIKTKCGVGGSVKDGLIVVQGSYKEKIIAWLHEWGYVKAK